MPGIELMQDLSEIIQYEHSEIPLYIRTADLSVYPSMSAPCHWHEDIEWIHRFVCILFHPSLFCSNQALIQQYVTPIWKNCSLEYLHYRFDQEPGQDGQETEEDPDLSIQKDMVAFLYQHYSEKIMLEEIALACGFHHLSYFSKYFYQNLGCTPREYRRWEK